LNNPNSKKESLTEQEKDIMQKFHRRKSGSYFDFKNFIVLTLLKTFSKEDLIDCIYLIRHVKDNSLLTVKVTKNKLDCKSYPESNIINDIDTLDTFERINSHFLTKILHINKQFGTTYIFLDFNQGGSLKFHLKKESTFDEIRVKQYIAQIIITLKVLHSHNIFYGILLPDDIFLDKDGFINLNNYEMAYKANCNYLNHDYIPYCSPEFLLNKEFGKKGDLWSLGVIIYEMFTGSNPYKYLQSLDRNSINISMYKKIESDIRNINTYNEDKYIREDALSFIMLLLDLSSENRDKLIENKLKDLQIHDFLKEINWNEISNKMFKPIFKPEISENDLLTNYYISNCNSDKDKLYKNQLFSDVVK